MDAAADRLVVFLVPHLYLTVFAVSAIDAVGIPFPGRILLVLAGTFGSTRLELALVIIASALGSLVGDHVFYLAGSLAYATVWVVLGRVFSDQVEGLLEWLGRQRAFFLIVPAAILAIVGYRLWRRRRHGTSRADELCGPAELERNRILRCGPPSRPPPCSEATGLRRRR